MRRLGIATICLAGAVLVALVNGCASKADTAATGPFAGKTLAMFIAGNELPASEASSTGPNRYTGRQESPDARLTGALEIVENTADQRPDGSMEMSGTGTVTNDNGTWRVEWTSVVPKGGAPPEYVLETLTGTGDYERLRGYFQGMSTSEVGVTGSDLAIGGMVFTGWIEEAN